MQNQNKLLLITFLFIILFSCNSKKYDANIFLNYKNNTDLSKRIKYLKIDRIFKDLINYHDFNGSFLVAHHNKIVYQNYNGFADNESKNLIDSTSKFQIASVSKQFTAFAIYKLKIDGKLNFDDNLTKYFPNFKYKNITIRNLLNHTSGLKNYTKLIFETEIANLSNQSLFDYYVEYEPELNFEPNSQFEYSNTNYAFLALLVEKIANQNFDDFLNENFFIPIKMKNTFLYKPQNNSILNTKGYYIKWNLATLNKFDNVYGDKEIYTTANDLFLWSSALYDNNFVEQKQFIENFYIKSQKEYRLGWVVFNVDNLGQIMYHTGHWSGYNSLLLRTSKNQNTIIILCNVYNDIVYQKITEIINILENDVINSEIKFY